MPLLQTEGLQASLLHQAGSQLVSRDNFRESEIGSHRDQMQDGSMIWPPFRVGFQWHYTGFSSVWRGLLFLAVLLPFRRQSLEGRMAVLIIYSVSLWVHDTNELFLGNMQDTDIFSSLSSRVQITIPSKCSGSLQKIESNEPDFIDMREVFIFRSAYF